MVIGQLTKHKHLLCDMRGKIQKKVDAMEVPGLCVRSLNSPMHTFLVFLF